LILGMIRSLQLIIHMPIMSMVVPSNVITLFNILIPIVMFDILEDFQVFQSIYPDSEHDALQYMGDYSQMRDIGYESFNIFMNLGTLAFLCSMYLVKVAFTIFILKPVSLLQPNFKKTYKTFKRQVFFGDLFAIFVEGYMEFLISSILLIKVAPE